MTEVVAHVSDDAKAGRFVIAVDGAEAELIYRTQPGRLILVHTEVPESLGGRGFGAKLVMAALARARERGETVVPWCPFARRWMHQHPDAVAGITVDWTTPPPPAP